jgi:hypothetical protein
MALRAGKSQGPRRGQSWCEPRPPGRLLRAGCGRVAAFAPCSQPASRPPPWGSPNVPLLRNGKHPHRQKPKRASHAVQAAKSSCTACPSVEPWWPSRLPFGARCAALTGYAPQKHPRNTVAASAISGRPNACLYCSAPRGERSKMGEVGRCCASLLSAQ